jgi:tetratricopeptide (TPR) repeat protein
VFSSAHLPVRRFAVTLIAFYLVNIPSVAQAVDQLEDSEFDIPAAPADVSAALDAAQKQVAVARANAKSKPLPLADALVALGDAQRAAAVYTEAENAYAEALKIVEHAAGPTNSHLLGPLRGLGFTLAKEGKHDQASFYLNRALVLSHRTDGLFNLPQLEILRQLARSEAIVKDYDTAEQHIKYLQKIGETVYGEHDPRMIPIICDVADWRAGVRAYITARLVYEKAIALGKKTVGPDDLALVRPLRSIAHTYVWELTDLSDHASEGIRVRRDSMHLGRTNSVEEQGPDPRYLSSDGEQALQRAVKILERYPEERTQLAATLLQLGDWYMIKEDRDEAMPVYARVSDLAKEEPSAAAALSLPKRLFYPLPPILIASRRLPPPIETADRYVLLEYSVTELGDVGDARIVETNASQRQANQILDAMRNSRFRPRFVDGKPVNATGIQYREVYKVRKDDDDDEQAS